MKTNIEVHFFRGDPTKGHPEWMYSIRDSDGYRMCEFGANSFLRAALQAACEISSEYSYAEILNAIKKDRHVKNTLETDFDRLLSQEPPPTAEECVRLLMKHAPKNPKNWSSLLRRTADYVDSLPEPVELSPRALIDIIKLSLREKD